MHLRFRQCAAPAAALVLCAAAISHADSPARPNQPVAVSSLSDEAAADDTAPVTPIEAPTVTGAEQPSRPATHASDEAEAASPASPEVVAALPLPPQENLPLGRSSTGDGEYRPGEEIDTDYGGGWLQTTGALIVVILLVVAVRLVLVRMQGRVAPADARRLVEVLARRPLGQKSHVVFLRINQRIIVASQTPGGMSNLAEITDPEEVAWVLEQVESSRPASMSRGFRQMLHGFDRQYDASVVPEDGGDQGEHLVDRTRERMSGMVNRLRTLGSTSTDERES